jgi:hypothetical protein
VAETCELVCCGTSFKSSVRRLLYGLWLMSLPTDDAAARFKLREENGGSEELRRRH